MQTEPENLTKAVIGDWVMRYHRGAGWWYALHSAPIIGINTAAQEYWLKQKDVSGSLGNQCPPTDKEN